MDSCRFKTQLSWIFVYLLVSCHPAWANPCDTALTQSPLQEFIHKVYDLPQPANAAEVAKILTRLQFYNWRLSVLNDKLTASTTYNDSSLKSIISLGDEILQFGNNLSKNKFPQGPTLALLDMFGDFQTEFYKIFAYNDKWFKKQGTLFKIIHQVAFDLKYKIAAKLGATSATPTRIFSSIFMLKGFLVAPNEPLKIVLVEGHAGIVPLTQIRHKNTAMIGYHLQKGIDFDYFRNGSSGFFGEHDATHAAFKLWQDQLIYSRLGITSSEQVDRFQALSDEMLNRLIEEIQITSNPRDAAVQLFILSLYTFEDGQPYPLGLADPNAQSTIIRSRAGQREDPKHFGKMASTFKNSEIASAEKFIAEKIRLDVIEFNKRWAMRTR